MLAEGELDLMLTRLGSLLQMWTGDAPARDSSGRPVHPLDPKARFWCLLGGAAKVAWEHPVSTRREGRLDALLWALMKAEPEIVKRTFAVLNDLYGQERILKLVQRARKLQTGKNQV